MPLHAQQSRSNLAAELAAIDWTALSTAEREQLASFINQAKVGGNTVHAAPLAPIPGAQADVGNGQPSPDPVGDLTPDQQGAGFGSVPNQWGVVRIAAFDAARASDPFFAQLPPYWGVQDTLEHFELTPQQSDCLTFNMGNARLFLGRMSDTLPAEGGTARYYPEVMGVDNRMHQAGQPFNDALCFAGDQTIRGALQKGFRLADAPALLAKWKAEGKIPQVV